MFSRKQVSNFYFQVVISKFLYFHTFKFQFDSIHFILDFKRKKLKDSFLNIFPMFGTGQNNLRYLYSELKKNVKVNISPVDKKFLLLALHAYYHKIIHKIAVSSHSLHFYYLYIFTPYILTLVFSCGYYLNKSVIEQFPTSFFCQAISNP